MIAGKKLASPRHLLVNGISRSQGLPPHLGCKGEAGGDGETFTCHPAVATHRNAAAMELPGTGLVLGRNNQVF